jgi:acyl-CoA thioesterase FadM
MIGDTLSVTLGVRGVGRTSMRLRIVFRGPGGEERVRVEQVVVLTEPHAHRPVPIPDELRMRIAPFHVVD